MLGSSKESEVPTSQGWVLGVEVGGGEENALGRGLVWASRPLFCLKKSGQKLGKEGLNLLPPST